MKDEASDLMQQEQEMAAAGHTSVKNKKKERLTEQKNELNVASVVDLLHRPEPSSVTTDFDSTLTS